VPIRWSVLEVASPPDASVASLLSDAPWVTRAYEPESDDSEALHYMLGVGYTRSRAGLRAGAHRAGRPGGKGPERDDIERQRAFLASLSPIWAWLLEHADTTLAVDREKPWIILGWCIVSEPNVVHAVGVKRNFCEPIEGDAPSVDIVRELLGERLKKHQVCTLELPQMATRGNGVIGLDRPRDWSLDPTWLLLRMGAR